MCVMYPSKTCPHFSFLSSLDWPDSGAGGMSDVSSRGPDISPVLVQDVFEHWSSAAG